MSVGIVCNEIGNFRPYSKISSFYSQKWFKVYNFGKMTGRSQFFQQILL